MIYEEIIARVSQTQREGSYALKANDARISSSQATVIPLRT
jgi:hypothetical protein